MEKVTQVYFGEWDSYKDLTHAFDNIARAWSDDRTRTVVLPTNFPTEEEVLLAIYDIDGYEGSSFVLYERNGQLFEHHSSHCSCNGLEWEPPEPTTWEALALRPRNDDWRNDNRARIAGVYGRSGDDLAVVRYWQLVDEHMAKLSQKPDESTPC